MNKVSVQSLNEYFNVSGEDFICIDDSDYEQPKICQPWNKGKLGLYKHTEETKRKISKAVKGNTFKRGSTVSPEGCLNMSKAAKGKRWYNNGKTTKMCYLDTQPEGFVLGRGKLK